jgi:hypothetical protein
MVENMTQKANLTEEELLQLGISNNQIAVSSDWSFSTIFFEKLTKDYNIYNPLNHTLINENLKKNDKFKFLREITSSEKNFLDHLDNLDYVGVLYLKESIIQIMVSGIRLKTRANLDRTRWST